MVRPGMQKTSLPVKTIIITGNYEIPFSAPAADGLDHFSPLRVSATSALNGLPTRLMTSQFADVPVALVRLYPNCWTSSCVVPQHGAAYWANEWTLAAMSMQAQS